MMLFPLAIVVSLSMVKDIFEDVARHQSDKIENKRKVLVGDYQEGVFREMEWKALHVGMIVKIRRDEYFPADLILLNSSTIKGICYIETKDLDGETNLKHKQSIKRLLELGLASDEEVLKTMKGAYV
jgi:P-type E1-E2 ATPase